MPFAELKRLVLNGRVVRMLFQFSQAEMVVPSLETLGRVLPSALLLRLVSRKTPKLRALDEGTQRITLLYIVGLTIDFIVDILSQWQLRRNAIERLAAYDYGSSLHYYLEGLPVYLRTDLVFGLRSGGSVGHIAGVLNNLHELFGSVLFITTDIIPTVKPEIETHVFLPGKRFRNLAEMWLVSSSDRLLALAPQFINGRPTAFVYQRYSLLNSAGALLAARLRVPFVLEFNGSEIWVARHWGRRLRHEKFATTIEDAVLQRADLIVVVSSPLRAELVARGIDSAKILVNPNGVDPDIYGPEVDGSAVRARYGLQGKTVIGFIGTFGRWHGAEVLVDSLGRLIDRRPELRDGVRLLMVGDGVTMPEVREAIARHGLAPQVVLTGLVPQSEGPAHLAAMDILASPHVPNPDGTPFFGSPTKLFEYMAMGRGIVASDLDQIGEVLEHNVTAWMVKPGNADSLADGLATLIDGPAIRQRLGAAAREIAVQKYSWREHTRRIIEALRDRCEDGGRAPSDDHRDSLALEEHSSA
jgi:glycosyltransferase involved in cell wall biosynthesis